MAHQTFHDISTRGMRWKKWGGPKGEGEGTDSSGLPLAVVTYHRVRCHGAAYYTLAKVTRTRSGRTYRLRLARCGEVRFEDS